MTGYFTCSDRLIERIHRNVLWTEASNLHGVPTDCPQRDERLAWLNDMTVRAEEAVYNFDLARLYSKWFDDILDTQGAVTGAIADTAPHLRYGHRPADPVASSFLIVPDLVYRYYGDARLIERGYDSFKRWIDYLTSLTVDHIIEQSEIGDGAPPVSEAVAGSAGSGAMSATTPGGLISTSFLYLDLRLMAQFARVLQRHEEVRTYERHAFVIREAINHRYFDAQRGHYGTGNQASNAIALYLDLVPNQHRDAVLEALIRDIESHDHHLTTGNICTKFVMDVLGRYGRADVAMKLLTQSTYPSWGYMVEMGATTMWERWEHVTGGVLAGMGSHNHPMYGAVDSWFYHYLAGIGTSPHGPGFAVIEIAPVLAPGIDHVDCSLMTRRGVVGSSWHRHEGGADFDLLVPPNTTANVRLPVGRETHDLAEVWEGESLLWGVARQGTAVEGVTLLQSGQSGVRVRLGSGRYHFRIVSQSQKPSCSSTS